MTNTPNPQANTLDEILINLDEYKLNQGGLDFSVAEHYAMYPELKSAKLAIEALITEATREARIELIEEILELPDTNGGCEDSHVKAKFTAWFDRRLTQLKENK